MSKFKEIEKQIENIGKKYDAKLTLLASNREELGDFQINDAMKIAKTHRVNPLEVAKEFVGEMEKNSSFKNVDVAGNGFINLSLSDEVLIDYVNELNEDIENNIDKMEPKNILVDYGGANVAKALHVGHLRSANIGEAVNRVLKALGHKTISDVHLGDSGLQTGLVVLEIKNRYPDLICFKDDYKGEDFELPITNDDLAIIYPFASGKSKEDEDYLEEAREITLQIQKKHIGYRTLWNKVRELSVKNIKTIYEMINANFDLWEGEIDSFEYIPEVMDLLNKKGLTYVSEDAVVMDVSKEEDKIEIPPVILEKGNGGYLYSMTDIATIYGRMKRFPIDEIWYTTDIRQELHFTQVFRVVKKAGIVKDDTNLVFFGFGTMNGPNGKPFKTRDGGVMPLSELIDMIKEETNKRLNRDIVTENEEEVSEKIAIAALKYADLLPFRTTDYIFDLAKFSDLDGKTGPYLLYSTIRIKSLLEKAKNEGLTYNKYSVIKDKSDRDIIINLLRFPTVLTKIYDTQSLSDLAEYIYKLTSVYNKFYSENRILVEENKNLRESWLILSDVVYQMNMFILDLFGIECPDKM